MMPGRVALPGLDGELRRETKRRCHCDGCGIDALFTHVPLLREQGAYRSIDLTVFAFTIVMEADSPLLVNDVD